MRFPGSAAAGALALVMFAATADADTTRIFGNWTTSCWSGEKRCAAENDGYSPPPRRARQLTLSLSRRDGADADWQLSLRLRGVRPAKGAQMAFQVDADDEIRFAQGAGYTLAPGSSTARLQDGEMLARLGRSLPAGKTLTVSFAGGNGASVTTNISLIGLSAALEWIDGRQDRRAGQALFAWANEPAAAAPTPKPTTEKSLPAPAPRAGAAPEIAAKAAGGEQPAAPAPGAIAATPPAKTAATAEAKQAQASPAEAAPHQNPLPDSLLKRHFAASECDPLSDGALSADGATRAELGDGKTLYIVPCFAGAYNIAYRVYLVRNGENDKARTLYFANFSQSLGWYGSDTLINASYDPQTKALVSFGKGRGLGDCGNAARYLWDGFDFRMIEYRAWDQCDGSRQPEQWPVVYRAAPGNP